MLVNLGVKRRLLVVDLGTIWSPFLGGGRSEVSWNG